MRARLGPLVALFLLALPVCGGNDPKPGSAKNGGKAGTAQATIKIGVLLPLTGGNAEAGANMLDAAKLAADDLNAAGGVLGRDIEIVSGDDGCAPEMATGAAETMLATGIVGIAGGYCSGAAIPASAVTDSKGIPYIAMATNPAFTDRGLQTVFRVTGRDDQQAAFAARFLAGPGGVKRLALLHDNSVYAKGLAELIRSANDELKLGMKVVFFDARFGQAPGPYTMYQYDMVRVLANAIFWAGSTDPKDIVEALRTTRHQGLTGEIFFDEKGDRQAAVHVTAIVRNGEFRPYKRLDPRGNWVDG